MENTTKSWYIKLKNPEKWMFESNKSKQFDVKPEDLTDDEKEAEILSRLKDADDLDRFFEG